MKYYDEMLSKWGFNDGEATPPDARECRAAYVRWINRRAEELGSTVRLTAYDRPGMHNGCLVFTVPALLVDTLHERALMYGTPATDTVVYGHDEPHQDPEMSQAIHEAYDQDLDGDVEVKVQLRPRRRAAKKR